MSARFILGTIVLGILSATAVQANTCDLDGKEAAFHEARRRARLQVANVQNYGKTVDVAVQRSSGNVEIHRGIMNGADADGNIWVNINGHNMRISKATDVRQADLSDRLPQGLIETRPPGSSQDVVPRASVTGKNGETRTSSEASGEISSPRKATHDRVRLGGETDAPVIGTRGDESYVSYTRLDEGGAQVPTQAKIREIWQDEKGAFHVKVFENPRDKVGTSRVRELTPSEIATLKKDPSARAYFDKYEETDIVARTPGKKESRALKSEKEVSEAVAAHKGETVAITKDDGSVILGEVVQVGGTQNYIFAPVGISKRPGDAIIAKALKGSEIKGVRKSTDHFRDELSNAMDDGRRLVVQTPNGPVEGRVSRMQGDDVEIMIVEGKSTADRVMSTRVKLGDVQGISPVATIAKGTPPPPRIEVPRPQAQVAPGKPAPRYRRIIEVPRQPIGGKQVERAVKETNGKLVVVTTRDGQVLHGYAHDLGRGDGTYRIFPKTRDGDTMISLAFKSDQVTSFKLADDYYEAQAAVAKRAGDQVQVATSNGPVVGRINKVDKDGVLVELPSDPSKRLGPIQFKRVNFDEMFDMRAINEVGEGAAYTVKIADGPKPVGKNTGQNGSALKKHRNPAESDSASGEIDALDQYDLDQSYLPHNGTKVSTRGDDSYVSYGAKGKETDAKITRMWTDDEGNLHVEVMDPPRSGSAVKPRELTPEEIATLKGKKDAKKTFEEIEDDVGTRNGPSLEAMASDSLDVDTKPVRIKNVDPAHQATVDANLNVVRGEKFNQVLTTESIGGNAGHGHAAVNVVLDQDGRIVVVGNIQNFPADVRKKIDDRTYTQGTFRVRAYGDGPGKDFDFIKRDRMNPRQQKVMDAVEDRLNADAVAKRARANSAPAPARRTRAQAESRLAEAGYPKGKLKNLTDKQADDFAASVDHLDKIEAAAKAAESAGDARTAAKYRQAGKDYKKRLDEALNDCF